MHQKKSELQIGKDSTGISSGFNPFLYKQHRNSDIESPPAPLSPISSTHKRPLTQSPSIPKSPTLPSSLQHYPFPPSPTSSNVTTFLRLARRHRLLLLLALPFFYFLVSHPSKSFLLDFLSAFAFSAALLFSLNLALPRLPSIKVFLTRSFPFPSKLSSGASPVFWSIGGKAKAKAEKRVISGSSVQVYSNGDVYEGEFHRGRCSGSGVYYYYMSGKYEGDWVDGKYDGYGLET